MTKFLTRIRTDELVRGSFILLVMINTFNILNYIFHLVMARALGPADYGIFAVLMSFVVLYTIPAEALQTIIAKHTSKLNIKKQYGKMKDLMHKSIRKSLKAGLIAFIILMTASLALMKILDISMMLFLITNLIIFSLFIIPLGRGMIQGRKKFKELGWTFVIEGGLKILMAWLLVMMGLRVLGAMIGVTLAVTIISLISLAFLREVLKAKKKKAEISELSLGNFNIWMIITAIMLFFTIDIILARAVLPAEAAGKYAVLSMIGKMIFYGTNAVSKAMFPISVQNQEEKKSSSGIFRKSLLMVAALCAAALLIMGLFPSQVIGILFGQTYSDVYSSLLPVALGFSFLSLTNLALLYGISKDRITKKSSIVFIVLLIIEIILLSMARTITTFSLYFAAINALILAWSVYQVRRK